MGAVETIIQTKISAALRPEYLDVINESGSHNVPAGSETHFKLVVVSSNFEGKNRVARHRAIYAELADELAGGVHALALHTYTPDEWTALDQPAPASPNCLGGSNRD